MTADLDTLLTALYVELTDRIIPFRGPGRTVTGFSLANPKLYGERDQARQTLERQPAKRPAPAPPSSPTRAPRGSDGAGSARGR